MVKWFAYEICEFNSAWDSVSNSVLKQKKDNNFRASFVGINRMYELSNLLLKWEELMGLDSVSGVGASLFSWSVKMWQINACYYLGELPICSNFTIHIATSTQVTEPTNQLLGFMVVRHLDLNTLTKWNRLGTRETPQMCCKDVNRPIEVHSIWHCLCFVFLNWL